MDIRHITHTFAPIIDPKSKVLILGSVPSVKSVQQNFYYMHPQNRFWRVMSALLEADLVNASSRQKTEVLLCNNIALYDSVYECDIGGSSDLAIFNAVPADIPSLIEKTKITNIFTNGGVSYSILTKAYPQLLPLTVKLPSTSPANAAFSLVRLLEVWKTVTDKLNADKD